MKVQGIVHTQMEISDSTARDICIAYLREHFHLPEGSHDRVSGAIIINECVGYGEHNSVEDTRQRQARENVDEHVLRTLNLLKMDFCSPIWSVVEKCEEKLT